MTHKFHLVLNKKLKQLIINHANLKKSSLSCTVNFIYSTMNPFLKKHFFLETKHNFKNYKCINADDDLYIYLDATIYNELKQIHVNLETFSIACILRWILDLFFKLLDMYGFAGLLALAGGCNEFFLKKLFNNKKWFKKKSGSHMCYKIDNTVKLMIILNEKYELIGFQT